MLQSILPKRIGFHYITCLLIFEYVLAFALERRIGTIRRRNVSGIIGTLIDNSKTVLRLYESYNRVHHSRASLGTVYLYKGGVGRTRRIRGCLLSAVYTWCPDVAVPLEAILTRDRAKP